MLQTIANRRSIRKYKEQAVPRHMIEKIIQAGILAPSAKNRQPWKFIVATGTAKAGMLAAMEKGLAREKKEPLLPESACYLSGAERTLAIMRQAPVTIFIVNPLAKEIKNEFRGNEAGQETDGKFIAAVSEKKNENKEIENGGIGNGGIGNGEIGNGGIGNGEVGNGGIGNGGVGNEEIENTKMKNSKTGNEFSTEDRVTEICNTQSIGAAIENMTLAAADLGLGSLWICDTFFAQKELNDWLGTKGELFAALTVGYAEEAPDARPRKKLEDVVEWRGL